MRKRVRVRSHRRRLRTGRTTSVAQHVRNGAEKQKQAFSKEALNFWRFLSKATIPVAGDGIVEMSDESPVYVAIVVDVTGYGPNVGAIFAEQNRYHGSKNGALEGAYELLEDWTREHEDEKDRLEREREWGDRADEIMTETFNGRAWKIPAREFARVLRLVPKAARFIEVREED